MAITKAERAVMRKLGRIGGKKSAQVLTPEQRSASARHAALTRHAKNRERAAAESKPEAAA